MLVCLDPHVIVHNCTNICASLPTLFTLQTAGQHAVLLLPPQQLNAVQRSSQQDTLIKEVQAITTLMERYRIEASSAHSSLCTRTPAVPHSLRAQAPAAMNTYEMNASFQLVLCKVIACLHQTLSPPTELEVLDPRQDFVQVSKHPPFLRGVSRDHEGAPPTRHSATLY